MENVIVINIPISANEKTKIFLKSFRIDSFFGIAFADLHIKK